MADLTYKDYKPANARVLVDYTKPPRDRVKFSYPENMTYSQALWRFGYLSFQNATATAFILLFCYFLEFTLVFTITKFLVELAINPSFVLMLLSQSAYAAPAPVPNIFMLLSQSAYAAPAPVPNILEGGMALLLAIITAISILFGIPAILTWYYGKDKEKLAGLLPKMNYQIALIQRRFKTKYLKIKPSKLTGKKFILPHFSNVFLNYKTTGDMADKLKKVRVVEYPYDYYIKNHKGKLSKQKVKNNFDFLAIFEFASAPENGYLEIEWI